MEKKDEIKIPWGTGIVGYVAESGEPVNIPDAYKARFGNTVLLDDQHFSAYLSYLLMRNAMRFAPVSLINHWEFLMNHHLFIFEMRSLSM